MTTEPGLPLILAFLAAFVTIWTLYFTISDAPAAIHHDAAEAYVWGREFQPGYIKHPPFWAWICGLWFLVLPRAGWAFAILTSLNAGVGLCGAWMLIGNFAEGRKATAATVLLLLTPFYTFLSYKYNANSIFLSIWPWTLRFFMRAIESRRLVDSVFFGVLMGVALLIEILRRDPGRARVSSRPSNIPLARDISLPPLPTFRWSSPPRFAVLTSGGS